MEEYDIPDDEFEKLYEEQMSIMNELSSLENVETDFIDVEENINNSTGCVNVESKEASIFKKRIHEDSSHQEIEKAFKRRKQSFPEFGYNEKVTIDTDIDTIDRIVCSRKAAQVNHTTSYSLKTGSSNTKLRKPKFHCTVPNGDFQSITTESGKRVYLDVQEENYFEALVAGVGIVKESVHMLSVPYIDLRMEAEKELLFLNPEVIVEENTTPRRSIDDSENCNEGELWVNKYKPRTYLDLLSDESTNRTVLQWIKLWDKVVFGIDQKQKEKRRDKTKGWKPEYFNKFGPEIVHEFDDHGRPQQKVLLLSGPPGLGKTTLAHIIAAHAGYNVVEMNASDDRSVDTFRVNLENATTMKTVFGTDKRPNCLIIDEIDGAPSPSINLLVNLLQSKKSKDDHKGKKKNNFMLFRPVICICNDLYVPSLRPLKQIALVIQFPPTHSTKLAQRLHSITQKQLLKADLSVLLALCSKTENDIRACLSTLQFIRIKAKELKLHDLERASVGQKDYQRSLFSIWNAIFTLPRPKRTHGFNPTAQISANGTLNKRTEEKGNEHLDVTSPGSRFNNILKMSQACGEYEKLALGWFENYLLRKFKHVYLEPVVAGLEWVTLTDILQKEIQKSQTWNLGAYLPFSFAAYHFLFASNIWQPLKFPNQYNEFLSNSTKSQSLLDMMTRGMSAEAQFFSSNKCIVQDTLPYLIFILQPNLRPVNVQLFSKKEKEALSRLVDSMISYNLTYVQEKSTEGSYSFSLDPNIEDIVLFSSIPKRRSIPYTSKQLIAREIELEKVRRAEQYFGAEMKESDCPVTSTKQILKTSDILKSRRAAVEQTNQGRVSKKEPSKPAKENERKRANIPDTSNVVARDFFGRLIASKVEDEMLSSQSAILRSDIWFKFKEGYSNAVRRPVKVQDLL